MKWNLDAMPGSLLTISGNPKISKGEKYGYWTAALHLAPHKASGVANLCAFASKGCAEACLTWAGRGSIGLDDDNLNMIQVARIQRTRWLKRDRKGFVEALCKDIARHVRRCERAGMTPAFRLNCLSDLTWERMGVMERFPEARFYDYSKHGVKTRSIPSNYHLTYSISDDPASEGRALEWLDKGVNPAIVFDVRKGRELPATYVIGGRELPVIDGDLTDLRFKDPVGVIVGLRGKGPVALREKGVASGFMRNPIQNPLAMIA